MLVTIYSKPGCRYCDYAKQLFERAKVEWEEVICDGVNAGRLERDYPDASTYPHIVIDGEVIGGLTEAAKYFLQKGLVKSSKNERT
jgi:glutaredoxin